LWLSLFMFLLFTRYILFVFSFFLFHVTATTVIYTLSLHALFRSNAGVKTVGIVEGSSLMGLTQVEFDELNNEEQIAKRNEVKRKFESVNADFVIDSILDLIQIVEYLNESMDKKW